MKFFARAAVLLLLVVPIALAGCGGKGGKGYSPALHRTSHHHAIAPKIA